MNFMPNGQMTLISFKKEKMSSSAKGRQKTGEPLFTEKGKFWNGSCKEDVKLLQRLAEQQWERGPRKVTRINVFWTPAAVFSYVSAQKLEWKKYLRWPAKKAGEVTCLQGPSQLWHEWEQLKQWEVPKRNFLYFGLHWETEGQGEGQAVPHLRSIHHWSLHPGGPQGFPPARVREVFEDNKERELFPQMPYNYTTKANTNVIRCVTPITAPLIYPENQNQITP